MSQHSQIQQQILAAGFVPGHRTTQVQYYTKGNEKVQMFHEGLWKRMPDRVEIVTSFDLPGVAPRADKWTQFSASNAPALKAFLDHIAPPKAEPVNPLLQITEEELDQYAPLA